MKEAEDIVTRKDIEKLVDRFYDRVQADQLLAPVFSHVNWATHLPVMYNFWSSMMLGESTYRGNPFQKHVNLPITGAHFERWLKLFIETVGEEFAGPGADEIKQRAQNIAHVFQYKMGLVTTDNRPD